MDSDEMTCVPKVSVCVITYNQEGYIRQCLQSIIDQVTDFEFEVVVGDDCSIDGTRGIISEFVEAYPGKVRAIFQKENIRGGSHNFYTVHQAALGEYIAHVDGDDYCLPGKLQVQADLLDEDKGCNIVFHRVLHLLPSGELREGALSKLTNLSTKKFHRNDFFTFIAIGAHSSKMYRKPVRGYEDPGFDLTDFFANIEQIGEGYARYPSSLPYGVYREGGGLATHGYRSKKALARSLVYFYKKYPECQVYISSSLLMLSVLDAKNLRRSWRIYFCAWLRAFKFQSVFKFLGNIPRVAKMGK